jgi:hypothetical protein
MSIRSIKKIMWSHLKKFFFDSLALKPLDLYVNFLGLFVAYLEPFNLVHKCLNWLLQISKHSYTLKNYRSKCGVNLVIWSESGVDDL